MITPIVTVIYFFDRSDHQKTAFFDTWLHMISH